MPGDVRTRGLPLVLLLAACGGFEQEAYDVVLDEAQALAVPYSCTDKTGEDDVTTTGAGGPSGLGHHQRWTVRADEFGATLLEMPDVIFNDHLGNPIDFDEDNVALDVLEGTTSSKGPFQYVNIRAIPLVMGTGIVTYVLRISIDNKSLEDDAIHGTIALRGSRASGLGSDAEEQEVCTSTLRFTGTRVK
ncbi:hypothetical protein [Myxococcus landrumensis]|uniref:Lipoprotein n=1 Tax=Myxococcus landrumensis TaxID=2813577 RepID=A0ABX7MYQ0_9BACT|nr:hypothetical protein [Myxococcus landrumus]QSQ11338.1 hypothetical protein JY572_23300 [Myxococcus landrumus]